MSQVRYPNVVVLSILSICLFFCNSERVGSKEVINKVQTSEQLLRQALTSYGQKYRDIRAELLNLSSDELLSLYNKLEEMDWKVRLQVSILKGWHANPKQYRYIRRVVYGNEPSLEGEKYVTGKPPVDKSSEILVDLTSIYLPALLEILYKEPDLLSDYAYSVCTKTIISWNAKRAVHVYRELLMDPSISPAYRERSIQPLFELNADHLYEDLIAIYVDEKNPSELRAASLASLGSVNDNRTVSLLRDVLKDPESDIRLRCAAAEGLGNTQNPAVIDFLANQYTLAESDDLKESIIMALGAIENSKAIGPLKSIQKIESDPGLMEIIDEILEELESL